MAKFDDQLKTLNADLDAVKADLGTATAGIAGLQQQIASLNGTVATLQTQLQGSSLTDDQQATLAAAVAEADSLKSSADALAATFGPTAPAPVPVPAGN